MDAKVDEKLNDASKKDKKPNSRIWIWTVIIVLVLASTGAGYYSLVRNNNKQKDKQNTEISELNNKADNLQKEIDDTKAKIASKNAEKTLTTKITKTTYTLELPNGWVETTKTFSGHPTGTHRYYNSSTGDYFEVIMFGNSGFDFSSDTRWNYIVASDGVSIKAENEGMQCTKDPDNPFCTAGDGKFNLAVTIGNGTESSSLIKGEAYMFFAGNIKTESPGSQSLQSYRDILASFRAK